jgi:hypothetical protein
VGRNDNNLIRTQFTNNTFWENSNEFINLYWKEKKMGDIPFNQRMGVNKEPQIDDDFPQTARVALAHLFLELVERDYINTSNEVGWLKKWYPIVKEIQRTSRKPSIDIQPYDSPFDLVIALLAEMKWHQLYSLCERVYGLLIAGGYLEENGLGTDNEIISLPEDIWVETTSLAEVQNFYSKELNIILAEENIAFQFINGQFQRRGHSQTQKSFQNVGLVLNNEKLKETRNHFNKAKKFFNQMPDPDVENCVKDALCALEAATETLTGKPASKDFEKAMKQLQGNGPKQIPPPIVEGMIKLHAYRGSGQGVSHAALEGNRVTLIDAELVLSLVASYITYLASLFIEQEDEIPF